MRSRQCLPHTATVLLMGGLKARPAGRWSRGGRGGDLAFVDLAGELGTVMKLTCGAGIIAAARHLTCHVGAVPGGDGRCAAEPRAARAAAARPAARAAARREDEWRQQRADHPLLRGAGAAGRCPGGLGRGSGVVDAERVWMARVRHRRGLGQHGLQTGLGGWWSTRLCRVWRVLPGHRG